MMVLRKLAVALLSAGVLLPGLGHALAVKELETKSALGEPFRAEVELIELGDLTADEIKASLATQEDFDRIGVERNYFLTDLKFNVVVNPGGRSYISVTSAKPVVEPYLDFVVRIAWPGNARLHEVTALLDPPVLADSFSPEVNAPISSTPVEAVTAPVEEAPVVSVATAETPAETPQPEIAEKPPEPAQPPEPTPEPAPAPQPKQQPTISGDSYEVQAGDTASTIAQQFRAGGVTVPQAVIALQRSNPDAFANNNVNQLKRGQVLRIPSESQMREISAQEALASVREQTDAWRATVSKPAAAPALEGRQVDATATTPAPVQKSAVQGKPEMKLLGAESGKAGAAAAGKEQGASVKPEEARKLSEIKTLTETAKAEKKKLTGKVETLDAKVKANDKQIELQNAKLAQLDAQLKQQQAKQAEAGKTATAPAAPAAPAPATPAVPTAEAPQPATPDAPQPAPAKPKPKPRPVVTEEPPVEVESNLIPIAAGGLAALLAVLGGGWWWNRRRREEAEAEATLAELEGDEPSFGFSEEGFSEAEAASTEAFRDEDWLNESASAAPSGSDRTLADPLEEAEQYIAYERFPQAAALLQKAIGASPQRGDLRMKLLEVCARQNDWKGFAEQEAWFEAAGDLEGVARAEELKSGSASGAAPAAGDDLDFGSFASSPAATGGNDLPSLEDLEMDFNTGVSASSPALPAVQDSDLGGGDLGMDFANLESEFQSTAKFQATPKPAAAADDLSFELDEAAFDTKSAPAAAADSGLEFSLDEAETTSTSAAGSSLGELEDFENLPDLAPPQEKPAPAKVDDGLSFGLDDLDFASEPAPSAAPETELSIDDLEADAGDLSFEDSTADAGDLAFEESPAAADDLSLDFDATMKAEPAAAPAAAAPAPAADMGGMDLGMDDEFDFLADSDENATKLDLARAYIDMGDMEGARDILQEVLSEGSAPQKDEAKGLLAQVG